MNDWEMIVLSGSVEKTSEGEFKTYVLGLQKNEKKEVEWVELVKITAKGSRFGVQTEHDYLVPEAEKDERVQKSIEQAKEEMKWNIMEPEFEGESWTI